MTIGKQVRSNNSIGWDGIYINDFRGGVHYPGLWVLTMADNVVDRMEYSISKFTYLANEKTNPIQR